MIKLNYVFRLIATILTLLAAFVCALAAVLFGVLYFAGLKAEAADKYGSTGKAVSIVATVLTIPLFSLGRFMARRREQHPGEP